MSNSASRYWHLKEENKRLTNSLEVIRDYVKDNKEVSKLRILEMCVKTINNMGNYKPLT